MGRGRWAGWRAEARPRLPAGLSLSARPGAHARAGDALACAGSLNAAESHLERARPGDEDPEWIDFFSYDRLCADGAECYRDLRLPEQTRRFTAAALAGRSDAYARSHGLRLAVGAQADLAAGDVDAACGGAQDKLHLR